MRTPLLRIQLLILEQVVKVSYVFYARCDVEIEKTLERMFVCPLVDIHSLLLPFRTYSDTFAYFSDELGYGLIAYSWEQNKSWRFEHRFVL